MSLDVKKPIDSGLDANDSCCMQLNSGKGTNRFRPGI